MKKRIIALALIFVIALSSMPAALAAETDTFTFSFTDVPTYHKDRLAIEFCARYGFVKGYTDTLFDPDGTLTREQYAVIWGRTFQLRMHTFKDVTKMPNEFDNAIVIMQSLGHVNGVSETEFGRTARISREQAIAIAQRAYLPGYDGKDSYKEYSDHELISEWARGAVSACKERGVLDGVFTGNVLNPGRAITRGEMCHLIFNFLKTLHEVKISDEIANGAVTVTDGVKMVEDKMMAYPGDVITLTASPTNEEYILVPGSLKYNDTPISGTTFAMPFTDVTITAEFAPKLTEISVSGAKTTYTAGEKLDLTGMVVTASYAVSGLTKEVSGYTTVPVADTVLSSGNVNLVVSYTENGISVSTVVPITVSPAA